MIRQQLTRDAVVFRHDPSLQFPLDAEQRETVARVCQAARAAGRKVEPNPIYRYLGFHAALPGGSLTIDTATVDYETYFGLSQPVVVTVSAVTEVDGHFVLERRSQKVAQGSGMLHVKPSGHIHPPQTPWQAVVREAEEELGLTAAELQSPRFLGLLRSKTAPCVTLVYRLEVALTWSQLLERRAVDSWEHEVLLGLPIAAESLATWLLENYQTSTGAGHGAVLLAGWEMYGEAWFEQVLQRL